MKRSQFTLTAILVLSLALAAGAPSVQAQTGAIHYFQSGNMPPGAVARGKLAQDPRLVGYVQPMRISAPGKTRVSIAIDGAFVEAAPGALLVGLEVGHIYQLKVTEIELYEGVEVFPTVEIVNRLYPPRGKETRFPVPIELTAEELELAIRGLYVTRVIYLEDRDKATPLLQKEQPFFDVRATDDPLRVADELGKPLAILRLGSRVPTDDQLRQPCGQIVRYAPAEEVAPPAPEKINGAIIREANPYPRLPLPGESPRPPSTTSSAGRVSPSRRVR